MIIAWGLLIISILLILGLLSRIKNDELKGDKGANTRFVIYIAVILCSAQYIWG